MNSFRTNLLIVLLIAFGISSCKKEVDMVDEPEEPVLESEINATGSVVLPNNENVNNLSIYMYEDSCGVNSGEFNLHFSNDHRTAFVTDESDEVRLMGYFYPGQVDFEINAKSTSLALLMNLPISIQVSSIGKTDYVNKILNDPDFDAIVSSVENLIAQGISPLDTNQTPLANELLTYFDFIANKNGQKTNGEPAMVSLIGNTVNFQNLGKSYSTRVGIYKDGILEESLTLAGVEFVPNSIGEILDALEGNFDIQIVEKNYEILSDGSYEFKIRNGEAYDDTEEDDYIRLINQINTAKKLFGPFIPLDLGCEIQFYNDLSAYLDANSNLLANYSASNLYKVCSSFMDFTLNSVECFAQNPSWTKYAKIMKKKLGFLSWISNIGDYGNAFIGIVQLLTDNSVFDTCFTFQGGDLVACESCNGQTIFTDSRDGQIYDIISLNGRCWFAQNLNFDTTSAIDYNNDPLNGANYGKLYNWYEANSACPNGWRLPSEEEWNDLVNSLGGELLAGGKLKSSDGWNSPNMIDNNLSGFNALPGGGYIDNTFEGIGNNTYWWSSSQSPLAYYAKLKNSSIEYEDGLMDRTFKLSCRCIKD